MQAVFLGLASLLYGNINLWATPDTYTLCSDNAIYTVDPTIPTADCIGVSKGHVAFVGSRDNALARLDERGVLERVYDKVLGRGHVHELKPGQIIVPGLTDAHAHILEYGFKMQLPLDGSLSVQEVVRRVEEYVLGHRDVLEDKDAWIHGMGWDQTKWDGASFPTAKDLDSDILRGRKIRLIRVDGHAIWVSQRVLDEIEPMPERVNGGEILRDSHGQATGVFLDTAMELVGLAPWTNAQLDDYFNTAMQDALSHGLTSIHDAGSYPEWLAYFKRKSEGGKLPIRLYAMGLVESDQYWGSQIERMHDHGKHGRLNVRSIKLISDGALGSWGAALLEPYTDNPSTSGIMRISPENLKELINRFYDDGWQVNVHCIGDKANRVTLDIFEDIIENKGANVTEWRPRIEHAQVPTHATSDMWFLEKRLGAERLPTACAYRSQLELSPQHVLPLGSDFPIESINPLFGFYSAVTRLSHEGTSPHGPEGWFSDERLTREQALKGMTLDAAYASFSEDVLGSLSAGKKADYVILDKDIMRVPAQEILQTKVIATVVDGGVAFGSIA